MSRIYTNIKKSLLTTVVVSVISIIGMNQTAFAAQDNWYPYTVDVWLESFNMKSERASYSYIPLDKAKKKHKICVSFPHMKDAYWLAVNYGVAQESKRLGVRMHLVEAGGYTNLKKQISQIEDCVSAGAKAVIIGGISAKGLRNTVKQLSKKGIPVIDVVNGISSSKLSAKSLVSFGEMGLKAGKYLAEKHALGTAEAQTAWFPGPAGAGWVEAGNKGFSNGIKGSAIKLVTTRYGDTGKGTQAKLIEDAISTYPNLKYIAGTAVTAEVAIGILKSKGLSDKIQVIAYYMTPGVFSGIKKGTVLAAPTDSTVIQGRIAIDQAVRILEGKPYVKHVGPSLYMVDKSSLESFDQSTALAPKGFKPVFDVK
ncbi:MAG: TMAO reductase system periplasmic protein TorT [Campylobacteraceae bacterium]|nr:TMAO reductase system periplasmic protein TorT [Campylobacteraceae bacterium]